MTVQIDAHAHIQRLVLVVKMATVVKECNTEKQRSVVLFLWAKRHNSKKCFLFMVGSVCRVKRFASWS
jgi:hypothetical protein